MEYVNLGKTGLKVSRICLGCMTYGSPATGEAKGGRHCWALNERESQPFFRQALDLGINFLRYRQRLFQRRQRSGAGPLSQGQHAPRSGGDRHQGRTA